MRMILYCTPSLPCIILDLVMCISTLFCAHKWYKWIPVCHEKYLNTWQNIYKEQNNINWLPIKLWQRLPSPKLTLKPQEYLYITQWACIRLQERSSWEVRYETGILYMCRMRERKEGHKVMSGEQVQHGPRFLVNWFGRKSDPPSQAIITIYKIKQGTLSFRKKKP